MIIMDAINRKAIFQNYYFRIIMRVSFVILIINNCAVNINPPKSDPSEYYISGIVYDECGEDELPVENVKIKIIGNEFTCGGIVTNEDGEFIITSSGCSELKDYLESLEAGAFSDPSFKHPEFSISWDDYELGYNDVWKTWKRMQWDDLELSFECDKCEGCCDIETGETKCEPGEECINRECCRVSPPGFYSTCCNCPLVESPDPDKIDTPPSASVTVISIEKCDECVIKNILVDGRGLAEADDNGYFTWDKDEGELFFFQQPEMEREVEIEFIIGDQAKQVKFNFTDGDNKNMTIKWNGINFISNWSSVKN